MNHSALKSFVGAFLLLVVTASAAGFILYEQERRGRVARDVALNLKTWDELVNAQGRTNALMEQELRDRVRLRSLVLASENDTISFLAYADTIAAETGVRIITSELKTEKTPEAGFDELSATFSLQGERAAVERVLKIFESLPYRSRIERLTLTRDVDGSSATVAVRVSTLE